MSKIENIKVITNLQLVETERQRLLKLVDDKSEQNKDWWTDKNRSDWARERFGENLTEKDGLTFPSGDKSTIACNCCGKVKPNNEKLISITFNYDDEQSGGFICKKCINKMSKMLEEKI